MNDEFDELPDDEFRYTLSTELAALAPPPLGDLVTQATQRGRRQRRRRTIGAVAGSVAAVAGVAALLAGTMASGGPGRSLQNRAAAAPASPSASADPGDAALVPADGPALVAATLAALPIGGLTSGYSTYSGPNQLAVRLNLTSAQGTGLVQVGLSTGSRPRCATTATTTCGVSPDGEPYRIDQGENCIQGTTVTANHQQNVVVSVQLSTCLSWDPQTQTNPPGIEVLTKEQALALAQAPGLNTHMSAGFVKAADAKYPNLPAIP